MKLTIQKWGNSAALRLPVSFLAHTNTRIGAFLDVQPIEGGKVVVAAGKPKYKLADLLAESPTELPMVDGWDDMPAVGREIL